jgi:hypothetical protein
LPGTFTSVSLRIEGTNSQLEGDLSSIIAAVK